MKKIFAVVAIALLLGACREGNVVEHPKYNFESRAVNMTQEVLVLNAVQLSAELTDNKKGLRITTSVQISPGEYEIYVFTDNDGNGTLDEVYDYQICKKIEVTDYHHKIFKKASRALLVEA